MKRTSGESGLAACPQIQRHVRLLRKLLLKTFGLPVFRAGLAHPLRCNRSFDGIAADRALVAVGGVWPVPRRRRMGKIERKLVSLEFRFGDGQFGDARLAVDSGTAVVAERTSQRAAAEREFQGLRCGARLGVRAGYGYFPCAGGIDD